MISAKRLSALFILTALALPAGAMNYDGKAVSGETHGQAQRPAVEIAIEARLLEVADHPYQGGLTHAGGWLEYNSRSSGIILSADDLSAVGHSLVNEVLEAPDHKAYTYPINNGITHEVESANMGVRAVFHDGEFLGFAKSAGEPTIKGEGHSPLRELLDHPTDKQGKLLPEQTKAFTALLKETIAKSPDHKTLTFTDAKGTAFTEVQAPELGLGARYRSGGKEFVEFVRLTPEQPRPAMINETRPTVAKESPTEIQELEAHQVASEPRIGVFDRAVERVQNWWDGLGEAGRVRIGKGLTIENATENLRYTELPSKEVKAFRKNISEDQLRSVAGVPLEEAVQSLPAKHADKITAVQQTFAVAATKGDMGLLVMEPKAGPLLEFAMNQTAPKEMLVKAKVDPVTRRIFADIHNPSDFEILANSNERLEIKDNFLFDAKLKKFVSSDFDLAAIGSKQGLGEIRAPDQLGYASRIERQAIDLTNETFESRGFKADPVLHGPQSNIQLSVDWSKNRMMGFIPGENRSYIIDSPKALGDYLNLAADKGLKFRIPDQWGVEPFLNQSARANVEIIEFNKLPKVGGK